MGKRGKRSDHEPIRLTEDEFDKLLNYSTSYPTGTTIGKCWKAHLGSGEWVHREYAAHPETDEKVLIITRDIIIVGKDGRRMGIQSALIIEKIVTDKPGLDFVATLDSGGTIVVLTPMRGKDSADMISVKTLEFGQHELEALLALLKNPEKP